MAPVSPKQAPDPPPFPTIGDDDRKQGPREKLEKERKSAPRSPDDPPPNDGLFEG